MLVNHSKCVGCGNCVAVCPMGAIHVENRLAHINQDECVECGACNRFVTSEEAPPGLVRAARRFFSFLHLRYDQPIDLCPTGALYEPELQWPRTIRAEFSNPLIVHPSTGITGRGTEEIKTNDATNRLPPGRAGILVEFGRPGVGCRFHDVQKITMALARVRDLSFEEKNPVTFLMKDVKTGELDPAILDEKFLSCILETLMPLERVPDALETIKRVLPELDTVVSLVVNGRCGPNGEIPYEEMVKQAGFTMRPNGKTNLGLARKVEAQKKPAEAAVA
ncbi:MAG: 4Fe-4S binding protein [Deltaproteobacteria bacterium]|nr:4Fe-4S binding protein [Deltaproteobacteria bacterium]